MYNLRTIAVSKEGVPYNQELSDHYAHIDYDRMPDEFMDTLKVLGTSEDEKKIHGFVVTKRGTEIIPLYRGQEYYIVKDSGVTYENLTHHSNRQKG